MEDIKIKEIPENENQKTIVNVLEKILNFNEQQKKEGIKILNPKLRLNNASKITNSTCISKSR